MKYILLLIALLYILLTNCYAQEYTFDFEENLQGWTPDFADYSEGDSTNWNLTWAHEFMIEIEPAQKGLMMKGDNFSVSDKFT